MIENCDENHNDEFHETIRSKAVNFIIISISIIKKNEGMDDHKNTKKDFSSQNSETGYFRK
uniref:Uncharacterized protein n=1 Tax=Lepeophtheirus salmonis TaxID=72036 RepID=A0A0K2TZ27_LEPSM